MVLRGWENDPDSRSWAFKAVGRSVPVYQFVTPYALFLIRDDDVLARLGMSEKYEPEDMEPDEPNWELVEDPITIMTLFYATNVSAA